MVGPFETMAVSLGISGALSLLCPFAAHLHPMALASVRLLMGLVQGPSFPALYSVLSRWAPPNELATMVTIAFSGKWHGSIISFIVQYLQYNTPSQAPHILHRLPSHHLIWRNYYQNNSWQPWAESWYRLIKIVCGAQDVESFPPPPGMSLGSLVAMGTSGWIIDHLGWEWVFYGGGILSLLWTPLWLALVRNSPKNHPFVTSHELSILSSNIHIKPKVSPCPRRLQDFRINIYKEELKTLKLSYFSLPKL